MNHIAPDIPTRNRFFYRGSIQDTRLATRLRSIPGIMVWPDVPNGSAGYGNTDDIWYEIRQDNKEIRFTMKSLVLDGPYILNEENGSLRHSDKLVPEFDLPDTNPIPIDRFFTIAPPAIRKSRSRNSTIRASINLLPSATPQKASAIMTEWHCLEYPASHSVGFDLRNLRYAWSTHGHIFILGEALPPVQGESFWCPANQPIYIPGGLKPERLIDMEIMSSKYLKNAGDILIFTNAERFEIIPGEAVHDLTRSSLRLTSYLSAV